MRNTRERNCHSRLRTGLLRVRCTPLRGPKARASASSGSSSFTVSRGSKRRNPADAARRNGLCCFCFLDFGGPGGESEASGPVIRLTVKATRRMHCPLIFRSRGNRSQRTGVQHSSVLLQRSEHCGKETAVCLRHFSLRRGDGAGSFREERYPTPRGLSSWLLESGRKAKRLAFMGISASTLR